MKCIIYTNITKCIIYTGSIRWIIYAHITKCRIYTQIVSCSVDKDMLVCSGVRPQSASLQRISLPSTLTVSFHGHQLVLAFSERRVLGDLYLVSKLCCVYPTCTATLNSLFVPMRYSHSHPSNPVAPLVLFMRSLFL
jgi:hypothetical protein